MPFQSFLSLTGNVFCIETSSMEIKYLVLFILEDRNVYMFGKTSVIDFILDALFL